MVVYDMHIQYIDLLFRSSVYTTILYSTTLRKVVMAEYYSVSKEVVVLCNIWTPHVFNHSRITKKCGINSRKS